MVRRGFDLSLSLDYSPEKAVSVSLYALSL